MNSKELSKLLTSLQACERATAWAKGKSLATVWRTCKRGDWMLWLCWKMADEPGWPTRKEVVAYDAAYDAAYAAASTKLLAEVADIARKMLYIPKANTARAK